MSYLLWYNHCVGLGLPYPRTSLGKESTTKQNPEIAVSGPSVLSRARSFDVHAAYSSRASQGTRLAERRYKPPFLRDILRWVGSAYRPLTPGATVARPSDMEPNQKGGTV